VQLVAGAETRENLHQFDLSRKKELHLVRIAFYGDSLTRGVPGASYFDILNKRLPEHTLINYGQGDDTAFSLHRRILKFNLLEPVDLSVLWVGTNDVPFKLSRVSSVIKRLRGKPWAKDPAAFQEHYRVLLDLLCPQAHRLVAVPPVFFGEDLGNGRNQYLEQLSDIIAELASSCANGEYLDLRAIFTAQLRSKPISDYLPQSVFQTALDALTLRSNAQIDQAASRRGLHFTLDGVHLNSAGAEIVADALLEIIVQRSN
jgi:lysophospholipase L1-like esterase